MSKPSSTRQALRQKRSHLAQKYRHKCGRQVARNLAKLPAFKHAKTVGVYLDAFGEVQTDGIIKLAKRRGKHLFVPIILPHHGMPARALRFCHFPYHAKTSRLKKHRLGMKSMVSRRFFLVSKLDILILPLVAVDKSGNRMGMGGGFYDRTLAAHPKKPLRIGLAYEFQIIEKLDVQPWDEKLDVLVTPSKATRF